MAYDNHGHIESAPCNPYELLANEIIIRAAIDYKEALKNQNTDIIEECERFFRSAWYRMLTKVDGETLRRKLKDVVFSQG